VPVIAIVRCGEGRPAALDVDRLDRRAIGQGEDTGLPLAENRVDQPGKGGVGEDPFARPAVGYHGSSDARNVGAAERNVKAEGLPVPDRCGSPHRIGMGAVSEPRRNYRTFLTGPSGRGTLAADGDSSYSKDTSAAPGVGRPG